jgi:hypothetical protein
MAALKRMQKSTAETAASLVLVCWSQGYSLWRDSGQKSAHLISAQWMDVAMVA